MVLFTPSDVNAPPAQTYQTRLNEIGLYAENFFHKELRRWKYDPKRKEIFERDEDGGLKVIHVRGDLPAAGDAYKQQWVSRQVHEKLRGEHDVTVAGNLFWIFVYVGDPPAKHDGYRGSGNSKDGGWAVLNYINLPGKISLNADPVTPFHDTMTLKGSIHEFGHGLGLPHIGPKVELRRGNTLMGPVTRIYVAQKMPDQTKAYLSEASAAVLSQHPIFTGDPTARSRLPKTAFTEVQTRYDPRIRATVVTGKLQTDFPLHRVIDDRDDKVGAYWVKAFVSQTDSTGRFQVEIPTPGRTGSMKLLAVYRNGAFTGDGKTRGIGSATVVPYASR